MPTVIDTRSVESEKIYAFSRRVIFAPGKNADTLKFCTVSGETGAKSRSHTHPGDELVLTLKGENSNFLAGNTLSLRPGESLFVPPETAHSTEVTSEETWEGISFYCDDCPLLKSAPALNCSCPPRKGSLHRAPTRRWHNLNTTSLFSPLHEESCHISLFLLQAAQSRSEELTFAGETVYCCSAGSLTISLAENELQIRAGMAVRIPARLPHTLLATGPTGYTLTAASCSSCPLCTTHPL